MGVPITFLDKYNPDEFEIVGMDLNNSVEELGIKEIGNEWVELYKKQGGKGHITASMHSLVYTCLLYTSPSPRDRQKSRMPSSA